MSSMAYCRVESIDPDTKEIVYLKKRKSDRTAKKHDHSLLDALERASSIRDKAFKKFESSKETPDNSTSSQE